MVYRSKKKMSKNVGVKVDLTKKIFTPLLSANEYARNTSLVKAFYADINYRLKIKWSNKTRKDTFFKNMGNLQHLLVEDI